MYSLPFLKPNREYEVNPLRKIFLDQKSSIITKKNTLEDLVHRISNRRKKGRKQRKQLLI